MPARSRTRPASPPNDRRLWDVRCGLLVTPADLRRLALRGQARRRDPSKIAILTDRDIDFGLSRMYELFRRDASSELQVFRSEAEALDWLRAEG